MYILDEILNRTEIELVTSLPVCNREYEIVFCYKCDDLPDDMMKIDSIRHVFRKDRKTGDIKDVAGDIRMPEDLKKMMNEKRIHLPAFTDEMEELYNSYEEAYELFSTVSFDEPLSEAQREGAIRLKTIFDKTITDDLLLRLYRFFGEDMFSCLDRI